MEVFPAVVVHGLSQATAALRQGRPVTLLSGAGAGLCGGAGWWRALVAAAAARWPDTPMQDILDCADGPGAAMAALRLGQRRLVLAPSVPAFPAVESAASELGAFVLAGRPPALDLDSSSGDRFLHEWLADDSACRKG
jgi:hypothetical protein